MSDRPQSSGPVDLRPVVVAQLEVGGAGVQRRPDQHRSRRHPIEGGEAGLDLGDGAQGVARVGEHEEPAVALTPRLHRYAVVGIDRVSDDLVVLLQRPHHQIGRFLPHPRTAFHVGEDERDDAVEEAGGALEGLASVHGSRQAVLFLLGETQRGSGPRRTSGGSKPVLEGRERRKASGTSCLSVGLLRPPGTTSAAASAPLSGASWNRDRWSSVPKDRGPVEVDDRARDVVPAVQDSGLVRVSDARVLVQGGVVHTGGGHLG
jgi:hypothetical protein